MWTDWIHWLSSIALDELLLVILPLICFDGVRYCFACAAMCLFDATRDTIRNFQNSVASNNSKFEYYPDVCVILAGLNEADTIRSTLESVWGSYPNLEIIVVDDGSSDGMAEIAHEFAATHNDVLVLRKPRRGGKSSALNFAIPFTKAEIIVCVDTDSQLEPRAIYRIVQPFADPRVGGVAGTVLVRNAEQNLVTQLQFGEYLRNIFVGRMLASKLGILGIVSGAFGAFRRDAILATGGWDVGPGEDGDLVLRLRKAGWKIVHAPYSQCLTNAPTTWKQLFRQRRRWEWSIVTFECRKHADLANPLCAHFRLSNFALLLDTWIFRVALTLTMFAALLWFAISDPHQLGFVLLTNYLLYLVLECIQWLVVMYYSPKPTRDWWSILCLPLVPPYNLFLKTASLVAIVEEFFWRRSYQDNFVPLHVRQVTWHW